MAASKNTQPARDFHNQEEAHNLADTTKQQKGYSPMISEVINSLYLTYVASEYLIYEVAGRHTNGGILVFLRARGTFLGGLAAIVGLVNLLDHVSGLRQSLAEVIQGVFHVPKIIFAIAMYLGALYVDISKRAPLMTVSDFWKKLGWAFLKYIPTYPLLAVLASFGFLFVLALWDILGLPEQWLNAPIYYGTLYGPLCVLYVTVKRQVVLDLTSTLPV